MFHLLLLPFLCAAPAEKAHPGAQPKPVTADAQALAWVPSGALQVTYFHPTQSALLRAPLDFFKTLQTTPPACWATTVAKFDATYQVLLELGAKTVNIAHGKFDRDSFEKCLGEVLDGLEAHRALARDGRVTVLTSKEGTKTYLAWPESGGVAWHDDRASVEKFLAPAQSLGRNPELSSLFKRVEPSHAIWSVAKLDLSSKLLHVVSKGYFVSMTGISRTTTELPVTFIFATASDASKASEALQKRAADPTLPAPVRTALEAMNPTVRGAEAIVNIMSFFKVPGAAAGMMNMIDL